MVPLIAAVRFDTQWQLRSLLVNCVAKLTRPLTLREREEMRRFPEFSVSGDKVTYVCRPEEAEASQKRLAGTLAAVAAAALRPRGARHQRVRGPAAR